MSETESKVKVFHKPCPIRGTPVLKASSISDNEDLSKPSLWYHCSCGVVFQSEIPKMPARDSEYLAKFDKLKEYKYTSIHLGKTYAPIIEELTYGRKMLEVGFGTGAIMKYFKKRGWVTFGIEKNVETENTDRIVRGDFETYETYSEGEFNVIWMGYVLHKFVDPIKALKKARDLMPEDGVLVIATSDIDFLNTIVSGTWLYWNKEENYIHWSTRALVRELEKLGFDVIVKRRNHSQRYGYYYDQHIIAQKKYF